MNEGSWMMPDVGEWIKFAVVLVAICAAIGLSELLRTKGHLQPGYLRKTVHIGVGFGILFAPQLFISPLPLLILSGLFALVNWFAIRKGWLKAMHGLKRRSYGTVYFPASLFGLTLFFWERSPELVALSMFTFSLGDAGAALVGESIRKPGIYRLTSDAKSVQGSIGMFVVSLAATVGGALIVWNPLPPSWYFLIAMGSALAVVSTATEALTSRGLDNLTVPFVNAVVLSVFLMPSVMAPINQLMMGISFAITIAVLSHLFRFLSPSGSVATFLLATLVFGLGGWKWTMPILAFFLFSSLLSVYGRRKKSDFDTLFEKTLPRDHSQVAANGGVAGTLLLLEYAFPGTGLYGAYVGSLAAVTADTWGTEVGILSRGETISLFSMKRVRTGTGGGVSLAGSLAGACGAMLISALGAQWTGTPALLVAGFVGGVSGSAVDSIVGGSIQAQFECVECGKPTERSVHCGEATRLTAGIRWVRNDGVNVLCALTGAGVAWLLAGN